MTMRIITKTIQANLIPFLDNMHHMSIRMGQNKAGKTIESSINCDCKMGEGYIGVSANFAEILKWMLNDTRCSVYRMLLSKHPITSSKTYIHKKLAPTCIKEE